MPKYDGSNYDPPAPVVEVTLRRIDNGTLQPNVLLLLDTGADVTLLPRAAIDSLGVHPIEGQEYALMGFDGSQTTTQAVEVDVIFLSKAYRGEYLLIDDAHGVLGRDVLAHVALLFHGPEQDWSEFRIV